MATTNWILDPTHSEIQFKVKHLMITNVTGSFATFNASASTETEDFTDASIQFSAATNSISTGNEQRDGHLKSADFFDAENYPEIKFASTSFTKKDNTAYQLKGILNIKGNEKEISLHVDFGGIAKDFYGNTKAGFTLEGKINRQDFGLTWSAVTEAGGVLVSDEVKLYAEIQLTLQP